MLNTYGLYMNYIIHKSCNHIYNRIKQCCIIHHYIYHWSTYAIIIPMVIVDYSQRGQTIQHGGANIDPRISLNWSNTFAINLPHHMQHNDVT